MITIQILSHQLVGLSCSGAARCQRHHAAAALLAAACRQRSLAGHLSGRPLTQSQSKSQKLSPSSRQQKQLIPISRSIYFRQCAHQQPHQRPQPQASAASSQLGAASPATGAASFFSSSGARPEGSCALAQHPLEWLVVESPAPLLDGQQRQPPEQLLERGAEEASPAPLVRYKNQSFDQALTSSGGRKLVVVMSWLEAKEKHIDKYRQFYLERGFDVLNVKTSPWDILLPNSCAKRISHDCVEFLLDKQYKDVLYHGFSVGGFMFGQVMLTIQRLPARSRDPLLKSIRGLVMDSLVTFEDAPKGIANSITHNRLAAKSLELLIKLYLLLGHELVTKYFKQVSRLVWSGPLDCPSLFFISKDDRIVDYRSLERLADTWAAIGIETHKMVVDDSAHVQIFRNHYEAYTSRVDGFLERIKML